MSDVQRGLMATDDAMVWAEEFCRIFDTRVVRSQPSDDGFVDPGLMVGWFANAMQVAITKDREREIHAAGGLTDTEEFLQRWHEEHPDDGAEEVIEDDDRVLEDEFLTGFYDGRNDHIDPYGDTA